jgi:hypothetical protein
MNKLPRKLKKKIIKVFGRGTYQGILEVKYDREKDDMDDFKGFGKMSKVIIKQGDLNKDINFNFIIL